MNRKTLARIRTGSHLYGLNTPESDEDFSGVFMPTAEDLLGLQKTEIIDMSSKPSFSDRRNTPEDTDEKHYSLPRYLHLALQNNPNIIELLFSTEENKLETSEIWEELVKNRGKIISQRVMHTFTGYAFSQKKKIEVKRDRYFSLQATIEFLEETYNHGQLQDSKYSLSEKESSDLNRLLKFYKGSKGNSEHFHKGMPLKTIYEKILEEYNKYGWRVKTQSFNNLNYDIKFGYHLIRILHEGISLLETGKLEYPITGKAREDILRIRNQEVSFEELMEMYSDYDERCQKAREKTILPNKPDFKWTNRWLVDVLKKSICGKKFVT